MMWCCSLLCTRVIVTAATLPTGTPLPPRAFDARALPTSTNAGPNINVPYCLHVAAFLHSRAAQQRRACVSLACIQESSPRQR